MAICYILQQNFSHQLCNVANFSIFTGSVKTVTSKRQNQFFLWVTILGWICAFERHRSEKWWMFFRSWVLTRKGYYSEDIPSIITQTFRLSHTWQICHFGCSSCSCISDYFSRLYSFWEWNEGITDSPKFLKKYLKIEVHTSFGEHTKNAPLSYILCGIIGQITYLLLVQ